MSAEGPSRAHLYERRAEREGSWLSNIGHEDGRGAMSTSSIANPKFSIEVITLPVSDVNRALRFHVDQVGSFSSPFACRGSAVRLAPHRYRTGCLEHQP